jgi:uncharacterized protein
LASNIFMTFAWYGHLKFKESAADHRDPGVSWGIAFFEYVLQVPPTASATAISPPPS